MKWASALATSTRLEDAATEATESLLADLGGSSLDLLFAFVTHDYADHFTKLPDVLLSRTGDTELIGCSASGVLGGGNEVEHEPGLALIGAHLPDTDVRAFHMPPDPVSWETAVLRAGRGEPDFVLLSDPYSGSPEDLLAWMDTKFSESTKIGGLVSGASHPGDSILILGDAIHRVGTVGVALSGDLEVDTVVAQGCRPIGSPLFVTRGDHHILYELDGQPATQVLESLYAELSEEDQELFRSSLFLGLVMREREEVYEHGDFLIRPIIGVDPDARALAIAAEVKTNQVVQFHVRDARASAEDLEQMLSRHQYAQPSGALLFSCVGRGRGLYGEPNHDTGMFHNQIGRVPLGGFFCSGEIGPVRGKTYIHGYTSSFGLFRRKSLM